MSGSSCASVDLRGVLVLDHDRRGRRTCFFARSIVVPRAERLAEDRRGRRADRRLDVDRDRHGRVVVAVGDGEVERVLADVGGERGPAEHAGAARRHGDLRAVVEVRRGPAAWKPYDEPVAVGVGAVEVELELGARPARPGPSSPDSSGAPPPLQATAVARQVRAGHGQETAAAGEWRNLMTFLRAESDGCRMSGAMSKAGPGRRVAARDRADCRSRGEIGYLATTA